MTEEEEGRDLAEKINEIVRAGLDGRKITVVLVGPGGAGKSTLANTLLMKPVCETGTAASAVTRSLQREMVSVAVQGGRSVQVEICDSPGFSGRKSEDERTLEELRAIKSLDVLLICFDIRGNSCRFLPMVHQPVLDKLSEIYQQQIRDGKAVIVLTKSNLVSPTTPSADDACASSGSRYVKQITKDWKESFRDCMEEDDCLISVPVLPAGHMLFENGKPFRVSPVDGGYGWLEELSNAVSSADTAEMPYLSALLYSLAAEARQDPQVLKNVIPKPSNAMIGKILLFAGGALAVGAGAGILVGAAISAALPAVALTFATATGGAIIAKVGGSVARKITSSLLLFWR